MDIDLGCGQTDAFQMCIRDRFPATITSWFGGGTGWNWLTTISLYLQPGDVYKRQALMRLDLAAGVDVQISLG